MLAASSAVAESAQERARALNRAGMAKFDLGEYDKAIDAFHEAYDVFADPKILFNLAQAHRKKKRYEQALELYRSYLRNLPDAPNRAIVEELMAELEGLLAAQRASVERPPDGVSATTLPASVPASQPSDPRSPPWYHDAWGWTLLGLGVTAVGVGAGFWITADQLDGDLATASESDRRALRGTIDERHTIGIAAFAIGGALMIGGIVKLAIVSPATAAESGLQLSLGPGWLGVRGRF